MRVKANSTGVTQQLKLFFLAFGVSVSTVAFLSFIAFGYSGSIWYLLGTIMAIITIPILAMCYWDLLRDMEGAYGGHLDH